MVRYADFRPDRQFASFIAVSPDGGRVAYADNVTGQLNLVVQPVTGGDATRLTNSLRNAVHKAVWSPDGEYLIFLTDTDGDEAYQLRRVPASGGPIEELTSAPGVQHELGEISHDGRWLSYSGNDRDPAVKELLVRDLVTGGVSRIPGAGGHMFPGGWSQDGSRFGAVDWRSGLDEPVYVGVRYGKAHCLRPPDQPPSRCTLGSWLRGGLLVLTDAGREFVGLALMDSEDGTLEWMLTPDWDVEHVALSWDERVLVWTVNVDGVSQLHARDLSTGVDLPDARIPAGTISALSLSADGSRLALRLATAARPTNIAIVETGTGHAAWLTSAAPAGVEIVSGIEPAHIDFPAFDGRRIPALLYQPRDVQRAGVAIYVHGGPEYQERAAYNLNGLYQYLLSQGVAVLAPNVRGSTGYGREYQKLIHHDFGGGDLLDLEAAVRYLHGLDWVAPDRIGVFGASYGGYAALSCLSRLPEYWACGVSCFGMSNLVTLARSVPLTWREMMKTWIGDPDTEEEFLLSRSPVTYVDDIRAPLFVIQGANDPRVVRNESDQIVDRLRKRGVDVRYDVYADEGHGFTKTRNELKANGDMADFLIAHLGAHSIK